MFHCIQIFFLGVGHIILDLYKNASDTRVTSEGGSKLRWLNRRDVEAEFRLIEEQSTISGFTLLLLLFKNIVIGQGRGLFW